MRPPTGLSTAARTPTDYHLTHNNPAVTSETPWGFYNLLYLIYQEYFQVRASGNRVQFARVEVHGEDIVPTPAPRQKQAIKTELPLQNHPQ